MTNLGLKIKKGSYGDRIELECRHQKGIIYLVPSEACWVCDEKLRHTHALAGFFNQISELKDPAVKSIMQRWGIYYRSRVLTSQDDTLHQSNEI